MSEFPADAFKDLTDANAEYIKTFQFRTTNNQLDALAKDVNRVRAYPLLNNGVSVGGAIYDVKTGAITPIDC